MYFSFVIRHYRLGIGPKSCPETPVTLHKKGIRYVCNSKYNAHTNPLFFDNNILKLKDLFYLNCAKLVYKKSQAKLHSYHSMQLPIKSQSSDAETRQRYDVVLKTYPNDFSKMNSLNYKIGKVWNDLPFDIKDGMYRTIDTFSKHVKKHYLSQYEKITCQVKNCYICKRRLKSMD